MFGPSRKDLHAQIERERREWAQERRELQDRLMILAGRPFPSEPLEPWEPDPEPLYSALDVNPEDIGG